MPELPDITLYLHALQPRIVGQPLRRLVIASPFLLRTFEPPIDAAESRRVIGLRRIGKRIVWELEDELYLVFHLMIAGRFRWTDKPSARPPGKVGLASFHFADGTLLLTEASPKKQASLHVVRGEAALEAHNPGGLDLLTCTAAQFTDALLRENHTLKRALTDPRLFDGIGNAYSDEILHAAGLSPVTWTRRLGEDDIAKLFTAARRTLQTWIDRLQEKFGDQFPGPGDITAFRPDFAVHGKFGRPCPVCATRVQRIRYADNETNYCPRCQTAGKLLADRSLSRLLKKDWPRTVEELEGG